ncbi:hypothetical protein TSOC_000375 [Tetrabaena socialis]|uniref:Uncharacterized protein n=1 Tax=Tetrabaena socialis TaxID=47790 RepID=A0A2J8AJH5_9CHLO|nr:hypothetical protein TSOC_000375 [Tetrabaena socialis]|eukprot:PNH12675.1 hypothetical protein TSOC_000375 [Tetrabaena socialis]
MWYCGDIGQLRQAVQLLNRQLAPVAQLAQELLEGGVRGGQQLWKGEGEEMGTEGYKEMGSKGGQVIHERAEEKKSDSSE